MRNMMIEPFDCDQCDMAHGNEETPCGRSLCGKCTLDCQLEHGVTDCDDCTIEEVIP